MRTSDTGGPDKLSLKDLDKVAITDARGDVRARIGYCVSLFFSGGGTVEKRRAAFDIYRDYGATFADQLTHFQPPGGERVQRLKSIASLAQGENRIDITPPNTPLEFGLFSHPADETAGEGETYQGGVGHFGFQASCVAPDAPGDLMPVDISSLSLFISAGWVEAQGHDRFLDLTKKWCTWLMPLHGVAGLSLIYDLVYVSSAAQMEAFPALRRFPGLHLGKDSEFVVEVQTHDNKKLLTTNWLTVVSTEFADRLGGAAKLSEAVGKRCPVHDYPAGVILQAGEVPQLGDVNRGIVLDEYRRVASAVKRLRFEDYAVGLFPVPQPLDAREETLKWLARFD